MKEYIFDNEALIYLVQGLEPSHISLLEDIAAYKGELNYKQIRLEIRPDISQLAVDKTLQRLLGARFVKQYKGTGNMKENFYALTVNGRNALEYLKNH